MSVINPSVFNVFVEGPAEILNRLEPSEIYGIIDLSESEPGSYQIKPKPVTPDENYSTPAMAYGFTLGQA